MNDTVKTQTNNTTPPPVNSEAIERLSKGAQKGIDAAAEAVHPTIDRVAAGAHKAVENADELAIHATEAMERAGVKGEKIVHSGTNYMREHPLMTLGLAVTAGYVLSRILAPRH